MAQTPVEAKDLVALAWLADAPLFIDAEQVRAFYDAVVRPEAEQKKITLSLKSLEAEKTAIGAEAKATISIAKLITTVFPFLDASVEAKAQASTETQESKEETRTIELQPISSPQRQLVQLALHYALQLPSRMKIVVNPANPTWYDAEFIQSLPRALVFIDFPPKTAFIPMAAELNNGKVVLIYEEAAKAFTGGQENPNPRPDEGRLSEKDAREAWDRYWRWFAENFDSYHAMAAVEKTVGDGGRIRWIDYRVPLLTEGKTAHLHVSGHGEQDTGVFAYNLVRRGYRHGLRLVGTVKSAPDVNVLALFEK